MGIANLGRAILATELYWRNEQAHLLHEARVGCIRALERRIQAMQIKDRMERSKATKQEQGSRLALLEEEGKSQ